VALKFRRAFRTGEITRTALVGAGGKTTTLFQLAASYEPPVLVTASTHLGTWQASLAKRHCIIARPEDVDRFAGQIEGVTMFTGKPVENLRLAGLSPESLTAVRILADQLGFPVLIEADGSRQRPLKAPADHEPMIPDWIRQVVVVAGMMALNQLLDETNVHRVERFIQISGLSPGDRITAEALAKVLTDPKGGLKGIPPGARKVALLNQVDHPASDITTEPAWKLAEKLSETYDAVVLGAAAQRQIWAVFEPCAGIILAAGGSKRFGEVKLLVDWKGKSLVRHVAEMGIAAGISPVVVVTGAEDEHIRSALAGLPVAFIHNGDWEAGQSTSVRAGLQALEERTGSAIFLLGDQPFITAEVIRAVVHRHRITMAPVVAPRIGERRANPVLFDRFTFPDLLSLVGDTGGRAILQKYPVEYVDWSDDRLLLDVDTPEDYRRLMEME
jgi:molybdenum cofactor cytidylyltransferase